MSKVKKVVLLAFASNDLKKSINRLSNQAKESNFYNEINNIEVHKVINSNKVSNEKHYIRDNQPISFFLKQCVVFNKNTIKLYLAPPNTIL